MTDSQNQQAVELESRVAVPETVGPRSTDLASTGLLSFYDRLRDRVTLVARRRAGKLGQGAVETLLLAPDLFILLVRLSIDSRVPPEKRRFIFGALAYFLTPIDLLPEGILGPAGYLEDVVLAAAVLRVSLRSDLEPLAEDYWSGPQKLRVLLGDLSEAAYRLLGPGLYLRLQRLLSRWGIRI